MGPRDVTSSQVFSGALVPLQAWLRPQPGPSPNRCLAPPACGVRATLTGVAAGLTGVNVALTVWVWKLV